MKASRTEERRIYVEKKYSSGYRRINKWCPNEYRSTVNAIIDILSCHKEDPSSTSDFHDFIEEIMTNAYRYQNEYEVKDEG
jgi:hypothetical protein